MGQAAFTIGNNDILLREKIICPKCKRDISSGKCITPSGMFLISLIALTIGMIGEKEGNLHVPPHLSGMAIVTQGNYDTLKGQSKASIGLVDRL